ncbi:MAG: NTP transferase domain-containing protein, partial [Pseudomonadota bacterium]
AALEACGFRLTRAQAEAMLDADALDGGALSRPQFVDLYARLSSTGMPLETSVRRAFGIFDADRDGRITHAEVVAAVQRAGVEDARALLNALDPSDTFAKDVTPLGDRPWMDGPVAGLLGAADYAEPGDHLLTAAVDTPFLPPDLAQRLTRALAAHAGATSAVATAERASPVTALHRVGRLQALRPCPRLGAFLLGGGPVFVPVEASGLFNVNTALDLAKAEAMAASR